MMLIESGHGATEIRLAGVFDIAAARRVAEAVDEAPYAEVRVDLTRVRECHDFALALLGETLAGRRAPTVVVGLGQHQRRLLRQLGIACGGDATDGAPA